MVPSNTVSRDFLAVGGCFRLHWNYRHWEKRFMSKSLELLRTNLLKDAWEASQTQGLVNRCLDLQVLVALMKKREPPSSRALLPVFCRGF